MKTLGLVVPCRNEARRLDVSAFMDALEANPWLTLCFVDDGSTDSTAETLAHMSALSPSVCAVYLPRNRGKAEAVRAGVRRLLEETGVDLVGFWDADLATPLGELPDFVTPFDRSDATEAVIGARWPHLGADIERSRARGIVGSAVRIAIKAALRLPVHDTQCGAKVFSRRLAQEAFREPFRTKWLFDAELLSRIGSDRLRRGATELPLRRWRDVPGSSLSSGDALAILGEIARLAFARRARRRARELV